MTWPRDFTRGLGKSSATASTASKCVRRVLVTRTRSSNVWTSWFAGSNSRSVLVQPLPWRGATTVSLRCRGRDQP